jgi:hypothetical protein
LLGFTGFFLNHEYFGFLWNIEISDELLPQSIIEKKQKSFEAYKIDSSESSHILVGLRTGLYVSFDGGDTYSKTLDQQVFAIERLRSGNVESYQIIFLASNNGIYRSNDGGVKWVQIALKGQVIGSITINNNQIYAVVDKHSVYQVDIITLKTRLLKISNISQHELPNHISLSRLIRDLHYGRGLISGNFSILFNDLLAFILIFLSVSGYIIYFSIKKIRNKQKISRRLFRRWIRTHSNSIILTFFVPIIFIIFITGIFLDHSYLFKNITKDTMFNTRYLPPVYRDLSTDIWGFDYDGANYRIGNRLGVFRSRALQNWKLGSEGFAYRMKRIGGQLLISGMGAPNRMLVDNAWSILKNTPHMPRDAGILNGKIELYTSENVKLPERNKTPLYYILLGLHDGKLLYGQWIFVNDVAVGGGFLLLVTGFIKWRRKIKV